MKKWVYSILTVNILIIIIFTATYRFGIVKSSAIDEGMAGKEKYMNITTTNKPLYYMVKDLVKDKHAVEYMLKSEEELWNYQYTEDSLTNIEKKDLFFYNGGNLEPWAEGFIYKLKKDKVSSINVSRGIKLNYITNGKRYGDKDIKENPYYWLGIEEYKVALSNIKNALAEKDPVNRDFYEKNYEKKLKEIGYLEEDIKYVSDKLKSYSLIITSEEFDYITNYLGVINTKIMRHKEVNQENINKLFKDSKAIVFFEKDNKVKSELESMVNYPNTEKVYLVKYDGEKDYIELIKENINALKKIK
ncbi:metal ABC transporter substrate-binding protein [Clostridium sp. MSJ-4]|uniref:Metal ABC transporter substrate-binding protein n=1 Tax=Clostridium simiarum TaxID=2841506 RepID=A0ABS6EX98_9CLOT|nr:metal ABC transporter substrate-binding protein [Clostridium simiarum]MBU5590345.1 metal ABC transporter substrate-binding protein [Clostridium simiarum]